MRLLAAVGASLLIGFGIPIAQAQESPRAQVEYKIEHVKTGSLAGANEFKKHHAEVLNKYANEGWRLVGIQPFNGIVYYFERPRQP